jgi:hypothetical protein
MLLPASAQTTKPLTPANSVSPHLLVTRIDTNCAVFKSAIKSQKPTRVIALHSTTWQLASDSDVAVAQKQHASYAVAEVWKQAGNDNWIRALRVGQNGGTHATQLCFRNDGTLARVKQAATFPDLDASASRVAYYNTNGSLIQRTTVFDLTDPSIAKRVKDLPYYKILP